MEWNRAFVLMVKPCSVGLADFFSRVLVWGVFFLSGRDFEWVMLEGGDEL